MDILEKIKFMMKERGWSEYRLAKNSGLSQSTISNIFDRNNVPTISTLEKITASFGVTLSQFFADADEAVMLSESEKQLLFHWAKLSNKQKDSLLNLLKEF